MSQRARLGRMRLLAFAIDCGVILAYAAALAGITLGVGRLLQTDVQPPATDRDRLVGHAVAFATLTLPAVLYFALADWKGATLGKRLLGLRVVGEGGKPLRLGQSILRSAVMLIPWEIAHTAIWSTPGWPMDPQPGAAEWAGIVGSEVLAALYALSAFVGSGQSPHDWLARTRVIRARLG